MKLISIKNCLKKELKEGWNHLEERVIKNRNGFEGEVIKYRNSLEGEVIKYRSSQEEEVAEGGKLEYVKTDPIKTQGEEKTNLISLLYRFRVSAVYWSD
jgi:hypothetical protein